MYLFASFILFFFSLLLFDCNKKSIAVKFLFVLSIAFFVLHDGLRWNIGTDWYPYYHTFVTKSIESQHEIGYAFFSYTIASITDNYTVFLLILALVEYLSLFGYIRNYSITPLISISIAYCIFVPLLGMNRQFLALSITLCSIIFIFRRNLVPFLVLVVFACCFHRTSIFFLPAYFLWGLRLEKKRLIVILVSALIIGLIGVLNFLPLEKIALFLDEGSAFRLQGYLKHSGNYSLINGLLFRLFVIVPCFFIEIPFKEKEKFEFFFKMYLASVVMYVLFQTSDLNIIAGRGAIYYSISSVVLVPYIIKYLSHDRIHQMIFWFIFFGLYVWMMEKNINGYALNLGEDIFRPYRCVLFPEGLF